MTRTSIYSHYPKRKKGQGIIPYQDYIMFFIGVPRETRAKEGVGLVRTRNRRTL